MKTKTPEPQKYVKFYLEDGFIKSETNLTSYEVLGIIERVKYGYLSNYHIEAEKKLKEAEEFYKKEWKLTWKPIDKNWKNVKGLDKTKYKRYNITLTAKPKVTAKKKVAKRKKK